MTFKAVSAIGVLLLLVPFMLAGYVAGAIASAFVGSYQRARYHDDVVEQLMKEVDKGM